MEETFVTSYCDHAHRMSDGFPVGHECDILPPTMLVAERAGDMERAIEVYHEAKPLKSHKGVKAPTDFWPGFLVGFYLGTWVLIFFG